MRKKIAKFTLGMLMGALLLTGCKDSKSSSDTSGVGSTSSAEGNEEQIVYARVTKVDGSKIEYEILEQDKDAKPDGEAPAQPEGSAKPDGEPPAQPEGSARPDGEPPAQPEGSARPDGEAPKGGDMMGFQSTGETGTITVKDSVKICYVEREGGTSEASLQDISEGTMIQLQYSEENELSEIAIPRFSASHDQNKEE